MAARHILHIVTPYNRLRREIAKRGRLLAAWPKASAGHALMPTVLTDFGGQSDMRSRLCNRSIGSFLMALFFFFVLFYNNWNCGLDRLLTFSSSWSFAKAFSINASQISFASQLWLYRKSRAGVQGIQSSIWMYFHYKYWSFILHKFETLVPLDQWII